MRVLTLSAKLKEHSARPVTMETRIRRSQTFREQHDVKVTLPRVKWLERKEKR